MKHFIHLLFCFPMLCILIFCSLLPAGCISRRATRHTMKVVAQRHEQNHLRLHDSLAAQQLHHAFSRQHTVVRHIRLTPPDSAGRQAVRSVTEIQRQETREAKDSLVSRQVSRQEQSQTVENDLHTESEGIEQRSPNPPFPLLWVVVCGAFAVWLFRRRA